MEILLDLELSANFIVFKCFLDHQEFSTEKRHFGSWPSMDLFQLSTYLPRTQLTIIICLYCMCVNLHIYILKLYSMFKNLSRRSIETGF